MGLGKNRETEWLNREDGEKQKIIWFIIVHIKTYLLFEVRVQKSNWNPCDWLSVENENARREKTEKKWKEDVKCGTNVYPKKTAKAIKFIKRDATATKAAIEIL